REIELLTESVEGSAEREREPHARQPRAPLIDETLDRRGEAELVEADGAQPADHSAHGRVHVVHALDDPACGPARERRVAHTGTNRDRGELDRIEILPELVVQLAREVLALLLFGTDMALHELAVHRERTSEVYLGLLARSELEARLPVAPAREPYEAERQDDERDRQLVDLEQLPLARARVEPLVELEIGRREDAD